MEMKPTLLISACLLGQAVRYDGQSKPMPEMKWAALQQVFELVPVCPECLGGLSTPRPPAEICGGTGDEVLKRQAQVKTAAGEDVSEPFLSGAQQTLSIAQQHACHMALLKANSPSCGNRQIYNGNFEKTLRSGRGVTATLLEENGVRVWNEEEWQELLAHGTHR